MRRGLLKLYVRAWLRDSRAFTGVLLRDEVDRTGKKIPTLTSLDICTVEDYQPQKTKQPSKNLSVTWPKRTAQKVS